MTVTLELTMPGVPDARAGVGLKAAFDHFAKVGVHPEDAAAARFTRDGIDMGADLEFTEADAAICHVWDEAENAAFRAVVGEHADIPSGSYLRLVAPPGEELVEMSMEEEFALGPQLPMSEAPMDGTAVIAANAAGEVMFVSWNDERGGWRRCDTEEPFEPVAWADDDEGIRSVR